jgi:hypothetical protein
MEAHVPPPLSFSKLPKKTVCPCCGFKFQGELRSGCEQCGVKSVGDPLARPERELPFLGRGLFIVATGIVLLLALLASTVVALFQRPPQNIDLLNIVGAAEFAVWKLKWIVVPVSLAGLWFSAKVFAGIRRQPTKFAGGLPVTLGMAATTVSALAVVTLIGVTIPDRIQSYRLAVDAEQSAKAYAYDRVLMEYRSRFGTLPTVPSDLRKLPDPDGVIADLLKDTDQTSYQPGTELANADARPMTQPQLGKPSIRRASIESGSDASSGAKLSFTKYVLRTPGADGIFGTEDDLMVRDGIVEKAGSGKEGTQIGTADGARLP